MLETKSESPRGVQKEPAAAFTSSTVQADGSLAACWLHAVDLLPAPGVLLLGDFRFMNPP